MARILVIDDDADMRTMLQNMLESAGYEVITAVDGEDGMTRFRAAPTSLVITDLFMPHQEGVETIIQLRKNFPGVPIIAISGKTGAKPMLSIARQLGASEVLEKPFFPEQMLDAVERTLPLGKTKTGSTNAQSADKDKNGSA